jgi:dihydrofolate synthase/folylpolyglutamate synthase
LQSQLAVTQAQMAAGLRTVVLAGRFQRLADNPEVILDVAHNPHAAVVLAENLLQSPCTGRTMAVFAMLADKDIQGVVAATASQIDRWYVASIDNVRAATVAQLTDAIGQQGADQDIRTFRDVASAYRQAFLDAGKNDRIIVFGSFFTVADVMRVLPSIHCND